MVGALGYGCPRGHDASVDMEEGSNSRGERDGGGMVSEEVILYESQAIGKQIGTFVSSPKSVESFNIL